MRTTTHGLHPGSLIYVANACSHRHRRGVFVEVKGDVVYYRSDYNGGVYPAPLTNVKAITSITGKYRKQQKRRKAA